MNRKDAEKLMGCQVRAWTAANGIYVGKLTEIKGKPWRGVVEITGILNVAVHYERSAPTRRGFRVGESIEVGGTNIRATSEPGFSSYLEALERELEETRAAAANEESVSSHNSWVNPMVVQALEVVVEAEKNRIETGEWDISAVSMGRSKSIRPR